MWNARLRLRALAAGLRALLAPTDLATAGAAAEEEEATATVVPTPASTEAAATMERVAADVEAYLSKVRYFPK